MKTWYSFFWLLKILCEKENFFCSLKFNLKSSKTFHTNKFALLGPSFKKRPNTRLGSKNSCGLIWSSFITFCGRQLNSSGCFPKKRLHVNFYLALKKNKIIFFSHHRKIKKVIFVLLFFSCSVLSDCFSFFLYI